MRTVDFCLLKQREDVLCWHSLPNMGLRVATFLIIALLPKQNNIWSFLRELTEEFELA
jgi:hypothetical protein